MGEIVGLYDKQAERIARREFPSVDEAREVTSKYTPEQIHEIAVRGFRAPESMTREEFDAVAAYVRIRVESSEQQ